MELSKPEKEAVHRYLRHMISQNQSDSVQAWRNAIRIVVLGDCGVGKKNIVHKLAYGQPFTQYDPLGGECEETTITIEGYPVEIHIKEHDLNAYGWQRAERMSQSRFESAINAAVCSDAKLLVYSVKYSKTSLEHLRYAHAKWREALESQDREGFVKHGEGSTFVVASMVDLDEKEWQISLEEGKKLGQELNAAFLQMSALKDIGVQQQVLMRLVIQALYQRAVEGGFAKPGAVISGDEPVQQTPTRNAWARFRHSLRSRRSEISEEPDGVTRSSTSQSHNENEHVQVSAANSSEFMRSFSSKWPN